MNKLLLAFFHRERFWENLTTPLFGTLTPPSDTTEVFCSFSHSYNDFMWNWMSNISTRAFLSLSHVFWRLVLLSWKSSAWKSTMLLGNPGIPDVIKMCRICHLNLHTTAHISNIIFNVSALLQWFLGAVTEGWASEVFQCTTIWVLVPVCEVSRVPHRGDGGGRHLLLPWDPDVDLCMEDAADSFH